jgi:hypothetical protein
MCSHDFDYAVDVTKAGMLRSDGANCKHSAHGHGRNARLCGYLSPEVLLVLGLLSFLLLVSAPLSAGFLS